MSTSKKISHVGSYDKLHMTTTGKKAQGTSKNKGTSRNVGTSRNKGTSKNCGTKKGAC